MSTNHIVTIIQARRGSSRLPDKVLLPLGGAPALERMLERVHRATLVGTVVVATTIAPEDTIIAELCARLHVPCYRGHPTDLLDRHWRAARLHGARHVVKIPSDCVLIDPAIIDGVLSFYLAHVAELDYASNLHPATCPDGNDVEVCSMRALEVAWREAEKPHEREHTTPFLWDQPRRFSVGNISCAGDRDYSRTHRIVLDYAEDYAVIRHIFKALHPVHAGFGVDAIIDYLDTHPDVAALNARYRGVNWYGHCLDALRTVSAANTCQPAVPQEVSA